MGSSRLLVLVKHALPILDASTPPREWSLGPQGEAQAIELAEWLRPFLPFRLVTSPEPKAMRTPEIVGGLLGVPMRPVGGFREVDRPVLPIVSAEEHERRAATIFARKDRPVLGRESAREALGRFTAASRSSSRPPGARISSTLAYEA